MAQQQSAALKRLLSDLKEIQSSPIFGVSASPLEENMFEWHCNFVGPEGSSWAGVIFHLILTFDNQYPAKSPSAEFMPQAFQPIGGATMPGKKGTKICLSIFSDFAQFHKEWANEKGTGWSPSYTTQTVLLNLVSFLLEMEAQSSYYSDTMKNNIQAAKSLKCADCGHTHDKPWPPLDSSSASNNDASPTAALDVLTCYATKVPFTLGEKTQIYGFGIARGGTPNNVTFSSPCEFITQEGFSMLLSTGKVESVMREEIHEFIPLFITPEHGSRIAPYFEQSISKLTGKAFHPLSVLQVLPKLLNSTVVMFMDGTTHTSERALHGYFLFHRLFLWAVQQYKELEAQVNTKIDMFVRNPDQRLKKNTPNVGEWLALLTVATKFSWLDVAEAYLNENFERNVMWYGKENGSLLQQEPLSGNTRITETFRLTKISRNLVAFQVLFIDIARPTGMSLQDVCQRYDAFFGLPTPEMEASMKEAMKKIKDVKNYPEWFELIKYPAPSDSDLTKWLVKSVTSAAGKDGYTYKPKGGYNNNRGGYSKRGRGGHH